MASIATANRRNSVGGKAPITRERDVALSFGQQPQRVRRASIGASEASRENVSRNDLNVRRRSLQSNAYGGYAGMLDAAGASPDRATPRGRRAPSSRAPSRGRSSSIGGNGAITPASADGRGRYSPSRRASTVRRDSIANGGGGTSVSRSRARAESPKPNFIVEVDRQPKPKEKTKRNKIDDKEVERQWREHLRRKDEMKGRDGVATSVRRANGPAGVPGHGPAPADVLYQQQQRRGVVEYPLSNLEREIPYDYIRVAKMRKAAPPPEPESHPPAIYAVPKLKRNKKSEDALDDRERLTKDTQRRKGQQQQQQHFSPSEGDDDAAQVNHFRDGVPPAYEDTYEYGIADDVKLAEEQDEEDKMSRSSSSSQATRTARGVAYQQWRDKTAHGLYKNVFVPPQECEQDEVPPLFEPALTAEESRMCTNALASRRTLQNYQERLLRYRLAMQKRNKLATVEDFQISSQDAMVYVPMVRTVRYVNEEENWSNALAVIARNKERMEAEEKAAERRRGETQNAASVLAQERDYDERELSGGVKSTILTAGGESPAHGPAPPAPGPRSPMRRASQGSAMGSSAINSATTPGWLRHREFSQTEWNELRGRDTASGPGSRRVSLSKADRMGNSMNSSSVLRNPTLPAWMHHLSQAQAEEEANDPQIQKLNEIETASMSSQGRRTREVGYTIGQSQRVGNRPSDFPSEESLSFGANNHPERSSAQFTISRPTRVDVSASHEAVVENAAYVPTPMEDEASGRRNGNDEDYEHQDSVLRASDEAPERNAREPQNHVMGSGESDAVAITPRGTVELEKVTFLLYLYSSFEATQEMKRITWWCAARGLSAFTVRAGQIRGRSTANGATPQPRSFSPTFFPDTSRFYDETLETVRRDLWLRKRISVAGHSATAGDIDIDILSSTLREAAAETWLQTEPDSTSGSAAAGADGQPNHDKDDDVEEDELFPQAPEGLHTYRPGDLPSINPTGLGSTAPPPPPPGACSGAGTEAVVSKRICFFTDHPHPSGAKVNWD